MHVLLDTYIFERECKHTHNEDRMRILQQLLKLDTKSTNLLCKY